MSLVELARLLLELEKDVGANHLLWEETKKTYMLSLSQCNNPDELLQILRFNSELRFPISLMMATYEKILENLQTPELLREYASYLYLHGSDWDEYSFQLVARAKQME
jgi:hypothetical protein